MDIIIKLTFYLKNKLPAVKNEVPDASLNEGFTVLASEPAPKPTLPVTLVAGLTVLIVLAVILLLAMRRKKQALPK